MNNILYRLTDRSVLLFVSAIISSLIFVAMGNEFLSALSLLIGTILTFLSIGMDD